MTQLFKANQIVLVKSYETSSTLCPAVVLDYDPDKKKSVGYGEYRKKVSAPYLMGMLRGKCKGKSWTPAHLIVDIVGEADQNSDITKRFEKGFISDDEWAGNQKWAEEHAQKIIDSYAKGGSTGSKYSQKELALVPKWQYIAKLNRFDKIEIKVKDDVEEVLFYELKRHWWSSVIRVHDMHKPLHTRSAIKSVPLEDLVI